MTIPTHTLADPDDTASIVVVLPSGKWITVTVGTSEMSDRAAIVAIGTEFEPDGSDGGPGLRVNINDDCAYEGVPYEYEENGP